MAYSIKGLDPAQFLPYFEMSDTDLADNKAVLLKATTPTGFRCRVSLDFVPVGQDVCLLHYINHNVQTPYHNSYAIYVGKAAVRAAEYVDEIPPVFVGVTLALRCFDVFDNLQSAVLTMANDDVDVALRKAFENPDIAYIHAHNAAHGCFAARVERH